MVQAAELEQETTETIRRFNDVFLRRDPTDLPALIAEDCVIETIRPGPNGSREIGRAACVARWREVANARGTFEMEETIVARDRATILWKLRWGDGEDDCARGVNVMRVRDGLIVEAKGYSKVK